MKPLALLLLACLSACSLTPRQWTQVAVGVAITGYVASRELANGHHRRNDCPQDNCGTLVQVRD